MQGIKTSWEKNSLQGLEFHFSLSLMSAHKRFIVLLDYYNIEHKLQDLNPPITRRGRFPNPTAEKGNYQGTLCVWDISRLCLSLSSHILNISGPTWNISRVLGSKPKDT